jgi:lipopolysaccharide assembly protein A
MKTFFWMIVFFFVVLVAIHFSLQNGQEVTLQYSVLNYHWEIPPIPLFLVIFLSIFVGVLIGGFGDLYRRFQLRRTLRQRQRTIERLEQEVQTLQGRGSAPSSLVKSDQ